MALDPAFVGFTYPATPAYRVGREKIAEFARAIGADDAVYFDPDAAQALGYPDVIAPPTFPIVLTAASLDMLIEDPALGLDFSRVVHGDQRYSYRRPIAAGDELVCVCTISEITERAGAGFLTTTTEVATVAGDPVATATSRLVIRAATPVAAAPVVESGVQA
jgi:acyl dehydratase